MVTIVTAAYKTRPDHLRAALESAVRQTYGSFELIVSDDSPDASLAALVSSFGDPRLRYRHNVPALGVAGNHWACFREARGTFIALLNHDDEFEPTFLERLVEPLVGDETLALAFCDHWVIDAEGRTLTDETDRNTKAWGRATLAAGVHRPFGELLLRQTIPLAMGAVFRRSALPDRFDDTAGPAYDLWIAYWLCRTGFGAYYVPERLSRWRTHPTNLTSAAGSDWALGGATCWAAIASDPALRSIAPAARRRAALAYYECARGAWRAGQLGATRQFGMQSLTQQLTWRGAVALALSTGLLRPSSADKRVGS